MKAKIIDGIKIAEGIKSALRREIEIIAGTSGGKTPNLAAVQVGGSEASLSYIKNQKLNCEKLGISYTLLQFHDQTREEEIIEAIKKAGCDKNVTGIIVHMPLPGNLNPLNIRLAIEPSKDVEGITPANLGLLFYSGVKPLVSPCTALAVMECIKKAGVNITGKEVVIVGHSDIVGKSLCLTMLSSLRGSATPTVCHIATKNLAAHTRRADILIVAVGKAGFIKGSMIKKGATVIDVGINRKPLPSKKAAGKQGGEGSFKITGDVAFDEAAKTAGSITPVPGGVGPVTTAMLLKNLVALYKLQNPKSR